MFVSKTFHNIAHPPYSISAQSNFAVGAVVNATFGSITEMTFYITALLRGHRAATKCYEEIVKAALTGTLLGCILFIPVSSTEGHMKVLQMSSPLQKPLCVLFVYCPGYLYDDWGY